MRLRVALVLLVVTHLAAGAFLGPALTPSRADGPGAQDDPFDPVFEIMLRAPKEKGCYGCHIGPEPSGFGFWFGEDKDWVLWTLATGINPDGEELGFSPIEGGRKSLLGYWLHDGVMPLGGTPWDEKDLALLDAWLATWE